MTTQSQVQGLGEFADRGFILVHHDDHIVEVHHQGEIVARFSQTGATEQDIQEECARHLAMYHGGNADNQADTGHIT